MVRPEVQFRDGVEVVAPVVDPDAEGEFARPVQGAVDRRRLGVPDHVVDAGHARFVRAGLCRPDESFHPVAVEHRRPQVLQRRPVQRGDVHVLAEGDDRPVGRFGVVGESGDGLERLVPVRERVSLDVPEYEIRGGGHGWVWGRRGENPGVAPGGRAGIPTSVDATPCRQPARRVRRKASAARAATAAR